MTNKNAPSDQHVIVISLGRRDGLVRLVHADDSPRPQIITGRGAAVAREQVVRSTIRALRLAARHPGAVRHLPGISSS